MILELKQARQLLEKRGWVGPDLEPFSVAAKGYHSLEPDTSATSFSVHGALVACGAYPEGWDALEAVVAPRMAELDRFVGAVDSTNPTREQLGEFVKLCRAADGETYLQKWLQEPTRTKVDVLRAFVRAIERSKKGERR